MQWWIKKESGYSRIMGTKPMTVSYALTDSPLGMLAWIREKMEPLVDGYVWSDEECITWAMVGALGFCVVWCGADACRCISSRGLARRRICIRMGRTV